MRSANKRPAKNTDLVKKMGGGWGRHFRARLSSLISEDTVPATKRAFAARVGVVETLAGQWLSGSRLPSALSIQQILDKYSEVSADWLLRGLGPKYRGQNIPMADLFAEIGEAVARRLAVAVPPVVEGDDQHRWVVDGSFALDACVEALRPQAELAKRSRQERKAGLDALDDAEDPMFWILEQAKAKTIRVPREIRDAAIRARARAKRAADGVMAADSEHDLNGFDRLRLAKTWIVESIANEDALKAYETRNGSGEITA